jgi:two-component system, NtrC family, sensor kinase
MKAFKYFKPYFLAVLFFCLGLKSLYGQGLTGKALADSLLKLNELHKSDTDKIKLIIRASKALLPIDPTGAMNYADSAMRLSEQHKWKKGKAIAYINKARIFRSTSDFAAGLEHAAKAYEIFESLNLKADMGDVLVEIAADYEALGNYAKAIETNFKALSLYEERRLDANLAWVYNNIGVDYYRLGDYSKATENYVKARELHKKTNDKYGIASALDNIASVYREQGEFQKVNEYNLQAIKLFEEINDQPALGRIYVNRGNFLQEQKAFTSALLFYKKAIAIAQRLGIKRTLAFANGGIGDLYFTLAQNGDKQFTIPDSLKLSRSRRLQKAYDYFSVALELSEKADELSLMVSFTESLSETEELRGNYRDALKFYKQSTQYKDSIFNDENERKVAALENERLAEVKDKEIQLLNKENALQASEQEKKDAEARRVKNIQYFIIAALSIVVLAVALIALLQDRNNKHKRKANVLLQQQKERLESTLTELKSTQSLLIQSAKMASLGELTAGIAHEIQNPLNFVNNFSEVNEELLSELKGELSEGKMDDAFALANNAIENQKKINLHGKRADAIVKNMLQHSRTSSGTRGPTDINALCDEYLRLSYHGLRAKDKTFNARFETNFDSSLKKINVIPQDVGRVILNLINNAFYAVAEKQKQNINGFEPIVSVSTRQLIVRPGDPIGRGKVEIKVVDNGNGIPEHIKEKIFQPFFTPKPTGQGTGLGLSLSYDIIRAHGGEIKVKSHERTGSEFIIQLPDV